MLILKIKRHFRARSCEWLLSGVIFLWGVQLLRPPHTFANPAYAELERWMSEQAWGWLCLITGGLRLLVLVINGSLRPSPHVRAALALIGGTFWGQLSVAFYLAGGNGTGLAVYPLFFCFEVFNAAMALGDAGTVDREAREARNGGGRH